MKHPLLFLLFTLFFLLSCEKEREIISDLTDVSSLSEYNAKIADGVTLLFFHATWCPKCAAQRPAVEELLGDAVLQSVFFGQVDFEKVTEVTQAARVQGFPTIVFYKNGLEASRFSGQGHSRDKIRNQLLELIE